MLKPQRHKGHKARRVREQIRRYLDRCGWDVADDEEGWRRYQRRCMREEYRDDEWSGGPRAASVSKRYSRVATAP